MTIDMPKITKVRTVPRLTCGAHSRLHAGIVRRARSMLPELPASRQTVSPRGRKVIRESSTRLSHS